MQELVDADLRASDPVTNAIIPNNDAEFTPLRDASHVDIEAALATMQAALAKACRAQPEWFIYDGCVYRNTKEGIIAYAFNP